MSSKKWCSIKITFPKMSQLNKDMKSLCIRPNVKPLNEQSDKVKSIVQHFVDDKNKLFDFVGDASPNNPYSTVHHYSLAVTHKVNGGQYYLYKYTDDEDRQISVYITIDVPKGYKDFLPQYVDSFDDIDDVDELLDYLPDTPYNYRSKFLSVMKNKSYMYDQTFLRVTVRTPTGEIDEDEYPMYDYEFYFVPIVVRFYVDGKLNTKSIKPNFPHYGTYQRFHLRFASDNSDELPENMYLNDIKFLSKDNLVVSIANYNNDSYYNESLFKKLLQVIGGEAVKDIYIRTQGTTSPNYHGATLLRVDKSCYRIEDGIIYYVSDDEYNNTRFMPERFTYTDPSDRSTKTYYSMYLYVVFDVNKTSLIKKVTGNVSFPYSITDKFIISSSGETHNADDDQSDIFVGPYLIAANYPPAWIGQKLGSDSISVSYSAYYGSLEDKIYIDGKSYSLDDDQLVLGFKFNPNNDSDGHYILNNEETFYTSENNDKETAYVIDTSLLQSETMPQLA